MAHQAFLELLKNRQLFYSNDVFLNISESERGKAIQAKFVEETLTLEETVLLHPSYICLK